LKAGETRFWSLRAMARDRRALLSPRGVGFRAAADVAGGEGIWGRRRRSLPEEHNLPGPSHDSGCFVVLGSRPRAQPSTTSQPRRAAPHRAARSPGRLLNQNDTARASSGG